MLDFTGKEHAHTLLRQSVRFCCNENRGRPAPDPDAAAEAARPVQAGRQEARHPRGRRRLGRDRWRSDLRRRPGEGGRRGGRGPGRGVLAGVGRRGDLAGGEPAGPARPRPARRRTGPSRRAASTATRSGSTPPTRRTPGGTSPGSSNPRNAVASLIVGAYHTAGQHGGQLAEPYPRRELEAVRDDRPGRPAAAGRGGDQGRRPGGRGRGGAEVRRGRPPGPAGVRPAAEVRGQRGRGAARGEVLPDGDRGVRDRPARRSGGGSWWPWPG